METRSNPESNIFPTSKLLDLEGWLVYGTRIITPELQEKMTSDISTGQVYLVHGDR
jgi:hypothetical protein